MHIICTICSDLLNQTESIYVTKCGHAFHHECLGKWIARSKSCPQCRNKVTDRCMFRLYPTVSNENPEEDITILQSRLDNALLNLHEQKTLYKQKEDRVHILESELTKTEEILNSYERKVVARESALGAMKEQIQYLKIQNRETVLLKEENESLKKNIQTMNGLQKILNATNEEVEMMLQGYSDVRTIATFASALKRALCESESKKMESRDRLQQMMQQLSAEKLTVAELQAKLRSAEEQITELRKEKDKELQTNTVPDKELSFVPLHLDNEADDVGYPTGFISCGVFTSPENDVSINSQVDSIQTADSPYLKLKQSNMALTALQRRQPTSGAVKHYKIHNVMPTETALPNGGLTTIFKISKNGQKHSIFNQKEDTVIDLDKYEEVSEQDVSYDGLGGHSKPNVFPVPNPTPAVKGLPKLSAKHRLKRPFHQTTI